ncbi:hypothetical protein FB451DRAFT_1286662 [Mycena latifolia]|nr:hypothetical protein FB451DRAFT_1286662 [Mycena latifolia]
MQNTAENGQQNSTPQPCFLTHHDPGMDLEPAETVSMDDSSSADPRLAIQQMITEGVRLVLAIRAEERTLEELNHEFHDYAPSHNIQYMIQAGEVDKLKKELEGIASSLAALPHAPVNVELDIGPFRAWIEAHREELTAFKTYCDENRPKSPLEEGEVNPEVECLSFAMKGLSERVASLEPLVNAEALEVRGSMMSAVLRQETQLFWEFLGRFDLAEMGEQGLRMAVQEMVLHIARDEFDKMVEAKTGAGDKSDAPRWWERENGMEIDEDDEMRE